MESAIVIITIERYNLLFDNIAIAMQMDIVCDFGILFVNYYSNRLNHIDSHVKWLFLD